MVQKVELGPPQISDQAFWPKANRLEPEAEATFNKSIPLMPIPLGSPLKNLVCA